MEYGLIGEHLSHSFSKLIHESIESYTYDLVELSPNELESFLMKRDFKAVNVTIPYKQDVIPYLDEISESAKEIGAVNIIVNKNGKLCGYNSDVDGFIYLLDRAGISVKDRTVLILGTGGAYKAIKYALDKLGAKNVLVASRSKKPCYLSYSEIAEHPEIEIVVNATPVGMYPHNEENIDIIDDLPNLEGYVDIIYNPLNTKNVVEASLRGIKSVGGLYMLIYQAIRSIEIFLDKKISDDIVDNIYKKIMSDQGRNRPVAPDVLDAQRLDRRRIRRRRDFLQAFRLRNFKFCQRHDSPQKCRSVYHNFRPACGEIMRRLGVNARPTAAYFSSDDSRS